MESILKLHPVVENICVVAHSSQSYCVALVVPSKQALAKFEANLGSQNGPKATESALVLVCWVMFEFGALENCLPFCALHDGRLTKVH